MAFEIRTNQEILQSLLSKMRGSGLSYTHRSSKAYALASVISREIETAYAFFDNNFERAFLDGASGQFLEALGQLFGVRRTPATRCRAFTSEQNVSFFVESGSFGSINGGADIVIPAGTIIETVPVIVGVQDPIQYEVVNEVTLAAAQSRAFVNVEAVLEGGSARVGPLALRAHDFTGYTDRVNDTLKVANAYAIVNGEDALSDDDMRYLISIAATAAQAGNLAAIRFAALSAPGVVDMRIVQYFDGIGSAGVFTVGVDNTPSDAITTRVQQNIDPAKSLGIAVRAYSPPVVGISFQTRVNTTEPLTASAQAELRQRLVTLTREVVTATRIGDSLELDYLKAVLLRADARILSFGQGTNFFDQIGIWRQQQGIEDHRIRGELLTQTELPIQEWEVIQPEPSLTSAFGFTF